MPCLSNGFARLGMAWESSLKAPWWCGVRGLLVIHLGCLKHNYLYRRIVARFVTKLAVTKFSENIWMWPRIRKILLCSKFFFFCIKKYARYLYVGPAWCQPWVCHVCGKGNQRRRVWRDLWSFCRGSSCGCLTCLNNQAHDRICVALSHSWRGIWRPRTRQPHNSFCNYEEDFFCLLVNLYIVWYCFMLPYFYSSCFHTNIACSRFLECDANDEYMFVVSR